ncbi:2-amino-4-hydroxy-6-hydroxymethyldihydropteridine diphosphokinase [Fusibacter sp. JL216-2]|uniref:2-amino-4-hydroxy-6- hydroxymethyldihydropteridine diphosphokinase n=1 Tax=Fusibacter sp. JL216-2 TaxID=3071453 RepID=UPI003D32CCD1
MSRAYLSLGSNIGDRKKNLDDAMRILGEADKIQVRAVSSFYETDPWGYEDQEAFLNIAAEVETTMTPQELLEVCQFVESELKRERLIHWGPRTIDVDILTYDDYTSQSAELTVPHPRMTERGFVLVPLAELAPELTVNNRTVSEWLSEVDQTGIRKI